MIKNPLPLLIIAVLAVVAVYGFFFISPKAVSLHYPVDEGPVLCVEGQTKGCTVGPCDGLSTCLNGRWGPCRWETVCTPGTEAPCTQNGCAYAYKECNECGTGYGPCEEYAEE